MSPPLISGAQCVAALAKIGYVVVRQKGSHVRLACPQRSPVTVPMHAELDRGTLRSILRTVDLSEEEFRALL
jgi:predicted RNA binding protein YcfA (HicA-like mRNA interferase family)